MKFIIFLALLAIAKARIVKNANCDGVVIHGINHEKEVLKERVPRPYQLAIDYDTKILLFSYSANTDEVFKSAYLNLKTNEYGLISGVEGGFANAVDSKTHKGYLGGRDGIYEFDFGSKRATNLGVTDKNIWQLFHKDGLYFSSYPAEEAYVYKNGVVKRVPELADTRAMLIAVDNDNNIFFVNSTGLFYYKKTDNTIVEVGEYTINGFTNDINGKLYFSTPTAIYTINEKTKQAEKLSTIINIYGLAIEGDGNIIYATDNSIVRLKSTGKECVTDFAENRYY